MSGQPELRLHSVEVERFKAAFRPGRVELPPMTVLIGRNGSGKSTLLEALQWVDTAIRHDARTACERYHGIHDLVNLRSQAHPPYFSITLQWSAPGREEELLDYSVRVEEGQDQRTPVVRNESLVVKRGTEIQKRLIRCDPSSATRLVLPGEGAEWEAFDEPDRLALGRAARVTSRANGPLRRHYAALTRFWANAVFLRLSPNRLAQGSPATRRSFDPLLDEEGQNLPALLHELTPEQLEELVESVRAILPDMRKVEVERPWGAREEKVYYHLLERMPYKGRNGRSLFPIPAWMLSEGTRRITALFALLKHDPPPSLLCIEEIENGLDPWSTVEVIKHLRSAAEDRTQVLLTTHSPWLLNHLDASSVIQVRRSEGDTVYEPWSARMDDLELLRRYPPGTLYVEGPRMCARP